MVWASSANAVGQTSGHWVKPKKTTLTLPLKSSGPRNCPAVSGIDRSAPRPVPLMSDPLNSTGLGEQAASAAAIRKTKTNPIYRETRTSTADTPFNQIRPAQWSSSRALYSNARQSMEYRNGWLASWLEYSRYSRHAWATNTPLNITAAAR